MDAVVLCTRSFENYTCTGERCPEFYQCFPSEVCFRIDECSKIQAIKDRDWSDVSASDVLYAQHIREVCNLCKNKA